MNISIVILTFNSQKYLQEVLQSVNFANEIILIDSGSTDDSLIIAKAFKTSKFFIKIGLVLESKNNLELKKQLMIGYLF